MATSSPWQQNDIALFVGGYNLIGNGDRINSIKLPDASATVQDVTGIGAMEPRHAFTGHKSYDDLDLAGWLTTNTDSINRVLNAGLSTSDRIFMAGDAGLAIGDPMVAGAVKDFSYKASKKPTALADAAVVVRPNGAVHHGVWIKPLATVTADGDSKASSWDIGASTVAIATSAVYAGSFGLITTSVAHNLVTGDTVTIAGHSGSTPDINGDRVVTVLGDFTFLIPVDVTTGGTGGTARRIKTTGGVWCYASTIPDLTLGGFTNLTYEFWHSVDNSVWVSLGTLVHTAAPSASRSLLGTTINRYRAVSWDFTGAGSGPSANVVAAICKP